MSYTYAYAALDILLGIVWLALFLTRKDLRRHTVSMSFLTAPLGFTQYWFYRDYWRPEYLFPMKLGSVPFGAEDVLFAFLVGGICSIIYETLFRKTYRAGKKRTVACLGIALLGMSLFFVLHRLGLSSIWASATGAILISILLISIDRDLRMDWIMSGLLMFAVIILIYLIWFLFFPKAISTLWLPSGLSGIRFMGIPIEELVWYFAWGMFGGIFYEFWINAGPYKSYVRKKPSQPVSRRI